MIRHKIGWDMSKKVIAKKDFTQNEIGLYTEWNDYDYNTKSDFIRVLGKRFSVMSIEGWSCSMIESLLTNLFKPILFFWKFIILVLEK